MKKLEKPTKSAKPKEKEAELSLFDLVDSYGENNAKAKEFNTIAEKQKSEIKRRMVDEDTEKIETERYKATKSVQTRQGFNMEQLFDIIKKHKPGLIKTQEYVDMEALEGALYHGELDPLIIAPCQTKNEVITLRITEVKNG